MLTASLGRWRRLVRYAGPWFLLGALLPLPARCQNFFPLSAVKPGLKGVGRTVFAGDRIEEFQVEILGVLQDITPQQQIILARLSGGPLADTGILQGMSGSPVYIDGKLLGAVALGFPFSKSAIAGIQPIESMIAEANSAPKIASHSLHLSAAPAISWSSFRHDPILSSANIPADTAFSTPFGSLTRIGTPVSFAGFTSTTLQTLAVGFRTLGFVPTQGIASSHKPTSHVETEPRASATGVVPGSMISVGLLTGDLNITADGTVTYVDGRRVYAFGHRFLDAGTTDLPFAHSDVIALIPNLNTSFKLSVPRAWVGSIVSDRSTAVAGEIGRSAHTIPLTVTVHSTATGTHQYKFQVVNDRFLTPFITQAALSSLLDATERTLGRGTIRLTGTAEWDDHLPTLAIRDTFVSDSGLVQQASTDAVVPLGFVLGAGFDDIHLKQISFQIETSETKNQLHLAQAWTSAHDVRPGDSFGITALLEGENGLQLVRTLTYRVPSGAPAGPLNLTISDGNTLNYPEFAGLSQSSAHSPGELIQLINAFRDNDAVYVRLWRAQPAFTISGPSPSGELTDPPPSAALILSDPSDSATTNPSLTITRGSEVDQLSASVPGYVVSGAKTLQVEVKE
ncbi:MAG TPA: SpoIVB peptidase S55 domain-containing protein [Bryobacteraceae bacterium]|nr:SpoIVB peptidase S55 domain-containing protein [Bryobacteraceae bacterium]